MTTSKLCEVCADRPASTVIVRRRCEDTYQTFVCPECASERSRLYSGAELDIEHILVRLEAKKPTRQSTAYACGFCGMTLAEIITDRKPGCRACYTRFADELRQSIAESQGHTRHVGKSPAL